MVFGDHPPRESGGNYSSLTPLMGGRRPTMETEQLGHGRRLPEFLPPSPVWDGNTLPRGAHLVCEAALRLARLASEASPGEGRVEL